MMGGPSTTLCLGFVLSLMVMAQCQALTPTDPTTTIKPKPESSEAPGSPSSGPTTPSTETTTAPPPSAPPSTDLTTQLPSTELTTQLPSTATQPPSVGTSANLTGGVASTANLATTTTVAPAGGCSEVGCGLNQECAPAEAGADMTCRCLPNYVMGDDTVCRAVVCVGVDCGPTQECAPAEDGSNTTCQCLPGYIRANETACKENPCNDVVCGGLNEVCNPTDGVIGYECQCQEGYVRNKTDICQDHSQATCDTVNCGVPEQCVPNANGTFSHCTCTEFQIPKEGICIVKTCENTEECHGPGDECDDHAEGYMCFCGPNRTINAAQTDCSDKPTTTAPATPSTAQPSRDPTSEPPVVPTDPAVETSKPVAVTTKQAAVTSKPATKVSTAAPGKGSTTVQPGQGTQPVHTSYKGPLIGLFIFLLVTTAVFIAIYMVRKRKLRNNYGRLDEDSSEGGWSAFSKNPIYRGDRDYQPL